MMTKHKLSDIIIRVQLYRQEINYYNLFLSLLKSVRYYEYCLRISSCHRNICRKTFGRNFLLSKNSRILLSDGNNEFRFWPIFSDFLLWEQERYYTAEQQRAILSRGGSYYELQSDYVKALEFYSKSNELGNVSELIIKITGLHSGMGY